MEPRPAFAHAYSHAAAHVAFAITNTFNENFVFCWKNLGNLASFAFIGTGNDFHGVASLDTDSHYSTSGARLIIFE